MARVAIVEDSLTDKRLTQKILESNSYQVIDLDYKSFNPDILAQKKPDLILVDIVLPGSSGYEICRRIKSSENTNKIPVVFISGKKQKSDILWGKMQGAEDYLVKPYQPDDLLRIVKKFVKVN